MPEAVTPTAQPDNWSWAASCRAVIAEAYNPPFYPSFDYTAEKAVAITKALHADSLRYPAASYFAYFPTRARYPIHAPCLSKDQCETIRRFVDAGGNLVATHLTSAADELGRRRPDFGLADVFGAHLQAEEPVEIKARIRIPTGRKVKAVRLLRADRAADHSRKDDWLEIRLPHVKVHELIQVELV